MKLMAALVLFPLHLGNFLIVLIKTFFPLSTIYRLEYECNLLCFTEKLFCNKRELSPTASILAQKYSQESREISD
jgi:hypothetical protein